MKRNDSPAYPSAIDPLDGFTQMLDRAAAAALAQATMGLAPSTIQLAVADWATHLARAPGKQFHLGAKLARKYWRLLDYAARSAGDADATPAIEPLPQDRRFADPAWKRPPFNLIAQSFLLNQQWWHAATAGIGGVGKHHEDIMGFTARQMLDLFAPANFIATNPVLQQRVAETGGRCLIDGFQHWLEDAQRQFRGEPPVGAEAFKVGETVATAKGKVVYRNRLIELIQYEPTTKTVRPEPILIVPAWIMKYYILDLSPENSLIRWLVERGHTVFAISWRNPDASDRELDMEDYRRMGVMAALEAIGEILPGQKIHATGYCLGGTLLSIAAAALARDGDDRLASVTLLAAQVDFTEPGELALFIDPSQMHFLDSMMWNRGYLSADQMAGAFQLLRSNDLVWSRMVREYLMGERTPMSDLMAWNADSTRMPWRMHAEYLQRLYLDNELAAGRFMVGGRPAILQNIRLPMFVVGTERDHVAPWKSVYKIHQFTDAEITFALTSGGHNAGIVSPPGHPRRQYRIGVHDRDAPLLSAGEWLDAHDPVPGSWWTAWGDWLTAQSGAMVSPPAMGTALGDAPGSYVHQR